MLPALALGTLMATVDISAVNIALPTLSRSFGVPLTTVQWVVLAYVVTITGTLLLFGRLADRLGKRRVYGTGLVIFTLASALCALAPGAWFLFVARAVQGLGAAMMTANGSAILVSSFPPAERGRALGAFGATVGVGLALGPVLGGTLVQMLSWRLIFVINLPLGVLALVLLRARVPDDRGASAPAPVDALGASIFCAALVLVMLGLSLGPDRGWALAVVGPALGGGIALLAAFLLLESRAARPLLPPGILGGPLGHLGTLTLFGQALSIALGIHLPLFLEELWGYDAARTGRTLAIFPAVALLMAPLAGRWSDRFGAQRVSFLGMTLTAAGLVVLARLGTEPRVGLLVAGMVTVGVGLGLFTVPNASALLGAAPAGLLGLASGWQGTMRNLGIAGGTAFLSAAFASRYAMHGGGRLEHAHLAPAAFAAASRDVDHLLAVVAVCAALLILARRVPPRAAAASRAG